MKTSIKTLAILALAATLGCLEGRPALALSIAPISQGTLPGGQIVSVVQINLDPGDTVPWHYHTGPGWGTIVAGTLTEDEGCGKALSTFAAGSSFSEIPGKVHRVFNFGTALVVIIWVEIYPGCDPNAGTIFVDGPRCKGNSGKSHLEKIPDCSDKDADKGDD